MEGLGNSTGLSLGKKKFEVLGSNSDEGININLTKILFGLIKSVKTSKRP